MNAGNPSAQGKAGDWPSMWEVVLGALLHDIGKLYQRGRMGDKLPDELMRRVEDVLPSYQGQRSHWHALWTDYFFDRVSSKIGWPRNIDQRWVRDLAVYHHKPLQEYQGDTHNLATWLIAEADRLAAGYERKKRDVEQESDEKGRQAFRRMPMQAIQANVRLDEREKLQAWLLPTELNAEHLTPMTMQDGDRVEQAYADLAIAFEDAWKDMIARVDGADPSVIEEAVLSLSERFLWAVPSSTVDEPDVSLHDHAQAVAAFAAAMFRYHEATGTLDDEKALRDRTIPKFRFFVGDLSGLQSTLFRLKNEQISGLNRILRGRSLRFQLIAEAAVRRVLQAFGMPRSAALQVAGGRFLVLLPALPEAEMQRRSDELRTEFDQWCAEQYMGDLGIGLALSAPFAVGNLITQSDNPDYVGPRQVRDNLAVAIETAKLRQLQEPAVSTIMEVAYPHGECAACGVRPAQQAGGKCKACMAEEEHGRRYPKLRAVVFQYSERNKPDQVLGIRVLLPIGEGAAEHDRGHGWRHDVQAHGPYPLKPGKPWVARFQEGDMEKYRRTLAANEDEELLREGNIKTFAALAEDSREDDRGRPMLALLKGDVDRLGRIFAEGLGERWSVARTSALSRMIDSYFTTRLPWLLEHKAADSYTVYAGGDDFMLVLPWWQGMQFATTLQQDFRKFAASNPSLTFSLGIALFDARTPISIAAGEAEERLERAKEAGRNRICAIEQTPLTWEEYARALGFATKLDGWLRAGDLPTSFLYRLLTFDDARMRIRNKRARQADYAWKARLGYLLARQEATRNNEEIRQAVLDLFGLDANFHWQKQTEQQGVRLAVSCALYRNR